MNNDAPICPYCDRPTEAVTADVVYKHRQDLRFNWIWLCRKCWAYVGCHGLTQEPLGTVANAALRSARLATHQAFDQIWKDGHLRRTDAYLWLANRIGVHPSKCHIAMFDLAMCKLAIAESQQFFQELEACK